MPTEHVILPRPVVIAGYVAPGPVAGVFDTPPAQVDLRWSGQLRITGTTKNTGTPPIPVGRLVRLHDQKTGDIVRQVWSDVATGAYSFEGIRSGVFYVVAFDHTGTYGGVIETDVTPEEAAP